MVQCFLFSLVILSQLMQGMHLFSHHSKDTSLVKVCIYRGLAGEGLMQFIVVHVRALSNETFLWI